MGSTGVKSPQTAGLGCVQRAQGVPLLGHPCFWVEVITSTYSSMISESHRLGRVVSVGLKLKGTWYVKIQLNIYLIKTEPGTGPQI